jgi:D-alanyl-lipoteichoic acid acyltransferase DltB (MBOAT superfamily)
MSFTSINFILFFAAFTLLYYLVPGRIQKYLLLAGNYVFYMWWKPAFGLLIFAGTAISYFCACAFDRGLWGRKKFWIALGAVYTIGVLFVFKYLDFFCGSILGLLGVAYGHSMKLLLPVGVSFFTFSVAGYLFDVGKGKIKPEKNFADYAAFVSFFPTIMAGPIGYARNFLPQLKTRHIFDLERSKRGLLRFVFGAGEKMIAADTMAIIVNTVYADAASFSNGSVLIAAMAYSLQIYFDFAAYSSMAIGAADILGFSVMENFDAPYLTRNIKSFWKKWHISLTSWLREYIYFPLGGSRKGRARTYINVLIVFGVSGLWHGAAVTFVIWGLLNGLYQVAGEITLPSRKKLRAALKIPEDGRLLVLWQMLLTFLLASIAWIFFRAGSVSQAFYLVGRIFSILTSGFGYIDPSSFGLMKRQAIVLAVFLLPYLAADVMKALRKPLPAFEKTDFTYWFIILLLMIFIVSFGIYGQGFDPQDFVYFKF